MSDQLPETGFSRWQPVLTLLLIVTILAGIVTFLLGRPEPVTITIMPPDPTPTAVPTALPGPVEVYITGAVLNPQIVVTLPHGSRVSDAIEAAGGFRSSADLDRVNVAAVLRDGDHVHVYEENEPSSAFPTPNDGGIVYINVATSEELQALPRIGPAMAGRIIDYREANGPFTNIDQLLEVSGIGPATLDQIRPFVSLAMP